MIIRSVLFLFTVISLGQMGCDSSLQEKLDESRDARYNSAAKVLNQLEKDRNDWLTAQLPEDPMALPTQKTEDDKAEDAANKEGDDFLKKEEKVEDSDHPLMAWRKLVLKRQDQMKTLTFSQHAGKPPTQLDTITAGEVAELKESLGDSFKEGKPYRSGWYNCVVEEDKQDDGLYTKTCVAGDDTMAKGTPTEAAAEISASFLRDTEEYWSSKTSLSRYLSALDSFEVMVSQAEKRAEDTKATEAGWNFVRPVFIDEANFDRWFVHAAGVLQLEALENRDIARIAQQPDYAVVFDIAKQPGDGFSDYISRLCFAVDGLKDECKNVPHEYRAALVERAYLKELKKRATAYKPVGTNAEPFLKVAEAFKTHITGVIDKMTAEKERYKEYLKLPSTYAPIAGMSGVQTIFSDNGIVVVTDKAQNLSDSYSGSLPKNFQSDLGNILIAMKSQPGNRIDYQKMVLEIPGASSVSAFMNIINNLPTLIDESLGVRDIYLVGRRRVDDSMRTAPLRVRLNRPGDSGKMALQFKEDKNSKVCDVLGRAGAPPVGKKDQYFLEVSPQRVRVAAFSFDKETGDRIVEDSVDLGKGDDLTAVQNFLDEHPGQYRAFISVKGNYSDYLSTVTSLLYSCKDDEIEFTRSGKDSIKRSCGLSEERPVTFVLGTCSN